MEAGGASPTYVPSYMPQPRLVPQMPYRVRVFTSDLKGAGEVQ